MRRTIALIVVLTAVLAPAAEPKDPKTLDVPAGKTAAAKALLGKLQDQDSQVRRTAATELARMGREALPALLDALNRKPTDDVRDRLNELLPAARKADFDARAELFLADQARKFDHDLLGWNELKAAVKDTKESRLLFADMLNDEPCREMLVLAFDVTEEGRKRFEKRWEGKLNEWRAVYRAEARAGLPAQGVMPKADEGVCWMVTALLADLLHPHDYHSNYRHPVVKSYLKHTDEGKLVVEGKGRYGGVVQVFAKHWVESQKERYGLTDASTIARYMKLDKADSLTAQEKLFELMVTSGKPNGSLTQLAGTRDPKYIASFRRLLDSDKPFYEPQPGEKGVAIQMRDAALSMCIALSGQDPTEYGFSAQYKTKATDDFRYSPHNYYFQAGDARTADDMRKAAFKQWAEWEKANPDKLKAKAPEKKDK